MALMRLKEERGFRVVEGEPTLVGYSFCNENGDRLGEVEDLIADTDAMKVRFLIVSLDQGLLTSRRIIIPLRDTTIDEAAERVICTDCSETRLRGYPTYEGGALPDLQKRFAATFIPESGRAERPTARPEAYNAPMAGERKEGFLERTKERIEHLGEERREAKRTEPVAGERAEEQRMELIEEELQVGKREVDVGDVTLHKTVSEREVCEPVELREERVVIERHPVHRQTDHEVGTAPSDVHMTLKGEEVVAKKVPFVREEILIRKETDVRQEKVCDTVRKEDVDTGKLQEVGKQEAGKQDVIKGGDIAKGQTGVKTTGEMSTLDESGVVMEHRPPGEERR